MSGRPGRSSCCPAVRTWCARRAQGGDGRQRSGGRPGADPRRDALRPAFARRAAAAPWGAAGSKTSRPPGSMARIWTGPPTCGWGSRWIARNGSGHRGCRILGTTLLPCGASRGGPSARASRGISADWAARWLPPDDRCRHAHQGHPSGRDRSGAEPRPAAGAPGDRQIPFGTPHAPAGDPRPGLRGAI